MKMDNLENLYNLSPMQEGMLFQSLYAPQANTYLRQLSYVLHGELNVSAFGRAWRRVVSRHAVLRTSFYWENLEQPLQVVQREVELPLAQQDWRELPAAEQETRLEAFLEAERERGFELAEAPLMRLALVRLAEDAYQFVWSYHHLLLDGWSRSLLLKEVFTFYEAFSEGRDVQPELGRPYIDYIAWLQQQDLSEAETFWRQALKGFHAPTPLPGGHAHAGSTDREEGHDQQQVELPEATTSALQTLARQQQLTLNTVIQGAWALLLSRYSGEDDVVFGAVVSGRPAELEGVESIIGVFINTLPVRLRVPPEARLLPWLKELQTQQAEMRQYEYSPLVKVQGWSEVPRGQALFESILVFENYPVKTSARDGRGGLGISRTRFAEKSDYPLGLVAMSHARLSLQINYERRRFDAATVGRMLGHLRTILESVIANPAQRLSDIPYLTEAEARQLLTEWNGDDAASPARHCIHHLFERRAEQRPDAVALVFEDEHLTYRELNRRANQLAHHLQSLGVGPEVRVGICLERSPEALVGLLATLKAGGAFVPLDPELPEDRLTFVLEDARLSVLLTRQSLVLGLPAYAAASEIVCLDSDREAVEQRGGSNPSSRATVDNLAYVIYTSGSTGKPKGVLVEHRGICNLAEVQVEAFDVQPDSRVLQFAPLSFDASVSEVCMALLPGATLCLDAQDSLLPGPGLIGLLREQAITVVTFPPSVLAALPEDELPALRSLIVAAETCSAGLVTRWAAGRRFSNAYGPTEATVCATIALCSDGGRTPPIGRPIVNVQTYLLDRRMRPVSVGVTGELYVGGVGLGRGYLNRPELTAGVFVPNPFSRKPGARLYKTGDLTRYRPDGEIDFLGRSDHQVKVRGFRVEPGEVEAVLGTHPAVSEAVVVAREDTPGDKRLVAYVVAGPGEPPASSDLYGFLKQQLPDYMVPSAFVVLDSFPRTRHDKVDRRALPAPDRVRPELNKAFVAPRNPTEEGLSKIWAEVLGIDQVGVHDNFFELGGHSLLATQVISRVRQAFKQELPLARLFEVPTVAGLAETIIDGQARQESVDISGIPRRSKSIDQHLAELNQLSENDVKTLLGTEQYG